MVAPQAWPDLGLIQGRLARQAWVEWAVAPALATGRSAPAVPARTTAQVTLVAVVVAAAYTAAAVA
jgi:hypothetical protein